MAEVNLQKYQAEYDELTKNMQANMASMVELRNANVQMNKRRTALHQIIHTLTNPTARRNLEAAKHLLDELEE